MTFRLWIGLWSTLFCIVIVAFDLSAIVRYFTRFTEESFAALIGIIFIVESLKKLYSEKKRLTQSWTPTTKFAFSEMSKYYKVHKGFDPDEMTFPDEGCSCLPNADRALGPQIFQNATRSHAEEIAGLNATMNGTIVNYGAIDWGLVPRSQCEL